MNPLQLCQCLCEAAKLKISVGLSNIYSKYLSTLLLGTVVDLSFFKLQTKKQSEEAFFQALCETGL